MDSEHDNRLKISYPPELVDQAIKEHIENNMNLTGEFEIDYTHRRKTRRVSADIFIDNMQSKGIDITGLPEATTLDTIPCTSTLNNDTGEFEESEITREEATTFNDPIPEDVDGEYAHVEEEDSAESMFEAEPELSEEELKQHQQEADDVFG